METARGGGEERKSVDSGLSIVVPLLSRFIQIDVQNARMQQSFCRWR